jgi:hypothetical protein
MATAQAAATTCKLIRLRIPAPVVSGKTAVTQMARTGSQDRKSPAVAIARNFRIGSGRVRAVQANTTVAAIMPMMVPEATAGVVSG